MTIILAAKSLEGIFVGYDTAVYLNQFDLELPLPAFFRKYIRKVQPLADAQIFMGISGTFGSEDFARFAKFDIAIKNSPNKLQTLNELVSVQEPPNSYIFGIVEDQKQTILVKDRKRGIKLQEVEYYAGIGGLMYPEVLNMFQSAYNTNMGSSELSTILEEAINLANNLSIERKKRIVGRGFGLGELTRKGYKELAFSTE